MKHSVSSTALTAVRRQRIVSNPKKAIRSSIGSLKFFGLLFTFPGERFSMVLFHFKSLHPLIKVERRCFGFLDECCTLHSECCTLWISILRTAITVVSFRVRGAITSQNETLSEFYGLYGCKPSMESFKPKKGYPNLNRVSKVFWPSFFHHVNFYVKTGSPLLVLDLPSLESCSPWYYSISNPS